MDKKKKMMFCRTAMPVLVFVLMATSVFAQNISKIDFCDKKYEYKEGKDTVTLFFNILDRYGNRVNDVSIEDIEYYLDFYEDGEMISPNSGTVTSVNSGMRIPAEYTFSVLVDLSIPEKGKAQIYETVGHLVESAPDSCVYVSFFGDVVSETKAVTKENYPAFRESFLASSQKKVFYSALYSKLAEFDASEAEYEKSVRKSEDYRKNSLVSDRAMQNKDKNYLFVFIEGKKRPDMEEIEFFNVADYQISPAHNVPKVMAFYYTEEGETPAIQLLLENVCSPRDSIGNEISSRAGKYLPSDNISDVLKNFEEVVHDAMYDYAYSYKVPEDKFYSGKVTYSAVWKKDEIGRHDFAIGTAERAWPIREEKGSDMVLKFISALLVTLLTILFFFIVTKIVVPYFRSKSFAMKYYKQYVPEANVSRRICHYCKQDITPGQMVVTKCKHIMHVSCWQQNGYKCAEYGQNCKTGIQSHVDWKELFTWKSLKDCYQVISGIVAGFISWVIYEIAGSGLMNPVSSYIVGLFDGIQGGLYNDCVNKISALLLMGLLLGLLLSVTFRSIDEFRKKDWMIWLKIIGLSILTGAVGMLAFGAGSLIMCAVLNSMGIAYIPWFCSLPAYLLFSVSVSLTLTIGSTIPVKSGLIGGLCSSVIGFIVLYTASQAGKTTDWMHMLLDFIIYGGGLGASLVTVRTLAEKYFLVIKNGVRAGQRIPVHKWMNATGGGRKVTIGMTGECEIQMNWEKSNKVAKEHAQLYVDYESMLPVLKPLATGVMYNTRAELSVGKPAVLSNGDDFKIGDTIFQYVETE